jgi:hypothetical protein
VPHRIDQLAERDRARRAGRDDELALDVVGHQFGNRLEDEASLRDQFVRADLRWTHRFYRILYAATFGFGAIEGATPSASTLDATTVDTRARYGTGGVTLRVHPSVFVDGHAVLGVSHDGFLGGAAGSVTLGRPWATAVSAGAEYLADLGASGWLRLQWDTAPPLLMGATVIRTDLPGARLDNGVLVRYDVAYKLADQVTARAAVSVGARDGGPHLGGGLGAAYEF